MRGGAMVRAASRHAEGELDTGSGIGTMALWEMMGELTEKMMRFPQPARPAHSWQIRSAS